MSTTLMERFCRLSFSRQYLTSHKLFLLFIICLVKNMDENRFCGENTLSTSSVWRIIVLYTLCMIEINTALNGNLGEATFLQTFLCLL